MADDKRIIQYPEVESVNVSDYMMMDSASNGTTRYQVQRLLSQASAEAQNKVDAEAAARAAADTAIDERVTANETDIASLKNDLTALSKYKLIPKEVTVNIPDGRSQTASVDINITDILPTGYGAYGAIVLLNSYNLPYLSGTQMTWIQKVNNNVITIQSTASAWTGYTAYITLICQKRV